MKPGGLEKLIGCVFDAARMQELADARHDSS